mmetsp:Transcript_17349/g.65662  ORF Transcript_17349/g.65662 Transcript_17349/m.65662 type:complete len:255 (-) Transcript_17349:102-866(-)
MDADAITTTCGGRNRSAASARPSRIRGVTSSVILALTPPGAPPPLFSEGGGSFLASFSALRATRCSAMAAAAWEAGSAPVCSSTAAPSHVPPRHMSGCGMSSPSSSPRPAVDALPREELCSSDAVPSAAAASEASAARRATSPTAAAARAGVMCSGAGGALVPSAAAASDSGAPHASLRIRSTTWPWASLPEAEFGPLAEAAAQRAALRRRAALRSPAWFGGPVLPGSAAASASSSPAWADQAVGGLCCSCRAS